ncbi:MAG: hypothetical protein NTV81_00025, partial [Candidatus Komeilibacteria bacterium]|nr:hypothetical protein [Candidatus Komeilibacteria bacterium]
LIKEELERLDWPNFYADYLPATIPAGVERGAEYFLVMKLPRLIKLGYPELTGRDISVSKVSVAFSRCLPASRSVVEMAEEILESETV